MENFISSDVFAGQAAWLLLAVVTAAIVVLAWGADRLVDGASGLAAGLVQAPVALRLPAPLLVPAAVRELRTSARERLAMRAHHDPPVRGLLISDGTLDAYACIDPLRISRITEIEPTGA